MARYRFQIDSKRHELKTLKTHTMHLMKTLHLPLSGSFRTHPKLTDGNTGRCFRQATRNPRAAVWRKVFGRPLEVYVDWVSAQPSRQNFHSNMKPGIPWLVHQKLPFCWYCSSTAICGNVFLCFFGIQWCSSWNLEIFSGWICWMCFALTKKPTSPEVHIAAEAPVEMDWDPEVWNSSKRR